MAIDIVGYLNTELTTWNTEKKTAMLNDFCSRYMYQDEVADPETLGELIPNPITKKQFMNSKIIDFIKQAVNGYRKIEAMKDIEELNGDLE